MSARRCDLAVLEVIVLQQALAGLVADRAVERMVDQQVFFDHRPALLHLLAVGDEHGAVLGRRLAGGHQLGHHRDRAGLGVAACRSRPGTCGNWPRPTGRGASSSSGMSMPTRLATWMPLSRSPSAISTSLPLTMTIPMQAVRHAINDFGAGDVSSEHSEIGTSAFVIRRGS